VILKNTVDLDSHNTDDNSTYLGIDYNLGFKYERKDGGTKLYFKLERNGPGDYDAPIFVHNTLINSGGPIARYRNKDLLPELEEFWLEQALANKLDFKIGLYTYEVGNGFSLNGSYENYGFSICRELENFSWRFYYCRPEIVYKNRLGPRIQQEKDQGYYYSPNASNFFALDAKINTAKNSFWPYIGVLSDYTSPDKRDNCFTAPIKKDLLGTLGLAWDLKQDKLSIKTELAHNFGKGKSEDPNYKDVYHTGYLVYTKLDYRLNKITPSLAFLLCSGNKVDLDSALNKDATLTSGKNRAFSSYSPFNKNLDDSIGGYNPEARPVVVMGSGYGQNNGVPRPGALASSDFEDLIMPSLEFDFRPSEKLSIGLYGYYLMAFARPVGTLNGEAKYLSRELGYEVDVFVDYKLTPHILFSILGGYFIPGRYYKEIRDDTDGSLFSPYLRGDGDADSAYQVELSVEFQF
jgi:hypothetical protein